MKVTFLRCADDECFVCEPVEQEVATWARAAGAEVSVYETADALDAAVPILRLHRNNPLYPHKDFVGSYSIEKWIGVY